MTDENLTDRSLGRRTADAVVTYDVRDLLTQIQLDQKAGVAEIKAEQAAGIARIERAMDGKADRADVTQVAGRVDKVEARLGTVETWQRARDVAGDVHSQRDQLAWRISGRVGAVIYGLITIGVLLAAAYIGSH